jgi:hypothetical protein
LANMQALQYDAVTCEAVARVAYVCAENRTGLQTSMTNNLYLSLGLLLLAAGTLLGIPHGLTKRRGDLERTELWRVAHLSTCVGGVSLIALTLAAERVMPGREHVVLVPFSVAAYLFFGACSLSGVIGQGWDGDRSKPSVRAVYGLQITASIASVIGVALLIGVLSGLHPI